MTTAARKTAMTHAVSHSVPAARPAGRARRVMSPRNFTIGTVALLVYLFVVHSYKVNLGAAAIAVGLFGILLSGTSIRGYPPIYWYVAFLLWSLVTLPASADVAVSWTMWTDALKILLIMFLTFNALKTPGQFRLIALAWLGMFALYPVRGTLVNFINGNGDFGRYGWNYQFKNYNDMAALTLIPLALSLDRLRSPDKRWIKLCALAGVISLPFIVLITQSRGGMLGLGCMVLFLLVRSRFRKRILMAVAGVGLVAMLFAPRSVWERIQGMTYLTSVETLGQSDSSAEQRYLIWQVAEAIIADNPFLGVGIGAYSTVHEQYARTKPEWAFARGYRDTHSTYLHVLAESGILGLILFMGIFLSAFYDLLRTARRLKNKADASSKLIRDRCQIYESALVGLAVCAVFGSLEAMVFPFLYIALTGASLRLKVSTAP